MDNINYIIKLYDYYGELITKKQQMYFEDYYFNNESLSEMSETYKVSRAAISKNINDTILKLKNYEKILKLIEKNKKINDIIINVDSNIKEAIKELI